MPEAPLYGEDPAQVKQSRLSKAFEEGRLVVTADFLPPAGGDLSALRREAGLLRGVTAVNVADMPSARLAQHPIAAARVLVEEGIEPILQLTGRDRNRLALQADLLAASALGVVNLLALSGDHLSFGDHPDAKPVFDLSATELLAAVESLRAGGSLGGGALQEPLSLFAGAAVNPGQEPLEPQLARARAKQQAGARFFQTQPVFAPAQAAGFLEQAAEAAITVPVLVGTFLLESAGAARFMNEKVPGVHVPKEVIRGLESAKDPAAYGARLAEELLQWVEEQRPAGGRRRGTLEGRDPGPRVPPAAAGVHLMSLNRFETVGRLASRVLPSRDPQG